MKELWDIVGFPLQLLVGELLYATLLRRRKKFILRFAVSLVVFLASAVFFWWLVYYIANFRNNYVHIYALQFLALFVISVFLIYACFDCYILEAVFCGIFGYATQNLMYQTVVLLTVPFGVSNYTVMIGVIGGVVMAVVYAAVWFFFCKRGRDGFTRVNSKKVIAVGIVFLIISIVLNSQIQIMETAQTIDSITRLTCAAFAAMGCLMTLFVLKSFYTESKLKDEKLVIDKLFIETAERSKMASENIEVINRKCHDLKYQIRALREMSGEERDVLIKELETAVMFYELDAKTGNAALDTILTEKVMYCKNNGIEFVYMVDGHALSAMKTEDIYTLFGNILDNAIEAEMKVPEEEKRNINLNIFRENGFLSINLVNYCPFTVNFLNGMPQTDKSDESLHGFGTKSVAFIVKKYNGHVVMKQEDELFKFSALIPVPEQ